MKSSKRNNYWYIIHLLLMLFLIDGCALKSESEVTNKEESKATIEGVWRIEEIKKIGGLNEGTFIPPASLFILTKKYYFSTRVTTPEPRKLFKTQFPSEAEIVEAFNSFDSCCGIYEFDGSIMVLYPIVSRSPNMMAGGSATYKCQQLEGDTATFTIKAGQVSVPGIEYAPDYTEERIKIRRLE